MPGGIEAAPLDELTQLPLPVLVSGSDYYQDNGSQRSSNYHHHFHPQKSIELGYTAEGVRLPRNNPGRIEGFALRYSRGQDLPIWLHDRYHKIFLGPQLPQTTEEKFTAVVLACAGVVPREALDLYTPDAYRKSTLDNKQHEFIRRRIYFEGAASRAKSSKRNHIGKFIADHALQSSLAEVMTESDVRKKVNEFLRPRSETQRFNAGKIILRHVVDASVAELIPIHKEAKKEGMVKRNRKELGEIVLKFFTVDRFQDYFDPLEDKLFAFA
jgi:hypothetical protein